MSSDPTAAATGKDHDVKAPSSLLAALKDSLPVGLGLAPLGVALGVLVVQAGLHWWWATVFTTVIYAGSFEFLLIGLISAFAPLATIAATALLVNVRHLFYGLSFPLHRVHSRRGKLYSTFALTDEAYALTANRQAQAWPGRRIVALQMFLHLYWVGGATLGGTLGALIPERVAGLDFALTALFVVLAIEAIRARRHDLPTPLLALLAALATYLSLPNQFLPVALTLFTTALLVRRFLTTRRPTRA
ncbi:branched-chain amino acid ABC transporter permease [Micromonospora sp. ALFpr18c]|uniref:AzlC family ABC transporter permease n=1 Tax=unclassified Micromonospora TaxID=2617518 RepID=UPI00124B1372|nr:MULTISPECIES: AzlC family ABC transporter permease [unclassified Micromonospora]KAB1940290.1 branched-chain amino acid ABC transporter permease [Micromonospora sp. ALFpr18c]MDG4757198.1 AzlC family ABC transporter permease [Micromonospora sp. WMMD710]